jgi:ABC-type Na+ efflux pump permease subunit
MFKKELRDASELFLECLLLLLVVPVTFVFDKYLIHFDWNISVIFNLSLLSVLIIYPLLAGTLVFQSEKKDNAFEYLLSLPLSKAHILIAKIIPRLLFLFALIGVSMIFSPYKNVLLNGFNLIVLFLISMFLCLTYSSITIYFVEIGLLFWLFYFDYKILNFLLWKPEIARASYPVFSSQLIAAALLLIPLGLAFWLTFKKLDIRPLKYQLKPYVFVALPAILTLITFTIVFAKKYWALAK